jgi:hypothetical protein
VKKGSVAGGTKEEERINIARKKKGSRKRKRKAKD